jgi:hypothetical protein
MAKNYPHRMLVVHNVVKPGERLQVIEPKPFRSFAFGSLLAYANDVSERTLKRNILLSHSLALPAGVPLYGREQLQGIALDARYDSVLCHLVLDHGGVVGDDFFSALRADFLETDGILLNPVTSITKNDVARASAFELETQTPPCVIKKNNNYNRPETVFEIETQAELDAWRQKTPSQEQQQFVVHKRLRYFGFEASQMYALERWIVLFGDLTVNHRYSDEFYIKGGTALSFCVRDERRMKGDLERLAESGYDWKGRSIDCAYDHDPDAWDARYAVLKRFQEAFRFDFAELDVIRPAKNEFVVIDVNNTPGPSYKSVHFRELAVRFLADRLDLRMSDAKPHIATTGDISEDEAAERAKRQQTFLDDARRLEEELARNPSDASSHYLLGQAYRDAGQLENALSAFKKRASMTQGWDEERFMAQLEAGRISIRLEAAEAVVLGELLAAYNLRPTRAEPLHELARYYRLRKGYAMATLFAKAGVETPRPPDRLSVSEDVYTWQALDELAVASSWIGDMATAKEACETLLARVQGGLSIPPDELSRIEKNFAQVQNALGG